MANEQAIELLLDLLTDLRKFEAGEDSDMEATNLAVRSTLETASKLKALGFVE